MMQLIRSLSPNISVNLLNPDEADANRRGEITPAQNDRLNAMALGRQGCGTIIVPFFAVGIFFFFLLAGMFSSTGISWILLLPGVIFLVIILGFSKSLYNWWRNSTKLKADRANGIVRSGVGELGYSPKTGFTAKVIDDDLILSRSNDASGLLPGVRYNFYYLPESRFVLSAEQLGEISSGQVRLALTDILAQANGFTKEDLQTNQNGQVTQSQRMAGLKKWVPGLIIMGVAFLFELIFLYPLISSNLDSNLIPVVFIGGTLVVLTSIGFTMGLKGFLDFNTSVPEMIEGPGHKITRRKSTGRSSRTVYYYTIGNNEFEVAQKAFPALLEGVNYRAYFMPSTKRLLSIEPTTMPEMERQ
jgi:hypothetical protein